MRRGNLVQRVLFGGLVKRKIGGLSVVNPAPAGDRDWTHCPVLCLSRQKSSGGAEMGEVTGVSSASGCGGWHFSASFSAMSAFLGPFLEAGMACAPHHNAPNGAGVPPVLEALRMFHISPHLSC